MMAFFVEQKVICVDSSLQEPTLSLGGLRKGAVYTVRWVGMYSHPLIGEDLCVRVEEIFRSKCPVLGLSDVPYLAARFRRVKTTKAGMEILNKLRKPSNHKLTDYVPG